jgi:phosphoglycerate dehydrogenase-like enzyme
MTEQKIRVAALDDYQGVAGELARWEVPGHALEVTSFTEHLEGLALIEALRGFEVVVAMRERTAFTAEVLASLPDLRLLVSTGGNTSVVDFAAAKAQGVVVSATRGLTSPAVEMTWALILAAVRNVPAEERALREGRWQRAVGRDLNEHVLGLVGLGRHGSEVARIGLAFGMTVRAWSQNLDPERARGLGVEPVSREELFGGSDIVSVHYKLSARSTGLVGAADFAMMRPSALFVNTSRGPIVDVAALGAALRSDQIAGAALDVYDHEPIAADDELLTYPRLILTPHIGFVTHDNLTRFYTDAVEDIAAYLAGAPLRVLNP